MTHRFLSNGGFVAAALLFNLAVVASLAAQAREPAAPRTLSLGLVSDAHQREIEENFRDFVRYVARKFSSGTELEGKVVVASTSFELAKLLEQRKVDFYMESAYPTYVINFTHGAGKLLLRRWKSGMADYHSVIFTRRDSEIKRLEDLKGKILVFEDAGSTSGYLLPKLFLQRRGLKLTEKSRFTADPAATDIGYIFARFPEKLVDAVLTKQAAAGAFSDDDFGRLEEKKKATSRSWRKPSGCRGTCFPYALISARSWPDAWRQFCSRSTRTQKVEKSCKKSMAPRSSICSREAKRQCDEDF